MVNMTCLQGVFSPFLGYLERILSQAILLEKLVTNFLCDLLCLGHVFHHAWGEKDNEFSAVFAFFGRAEQVAEYRNVHQTGNAVAAVFFAVADQAAEDGGLSALHGDAALHAALQEGALFGGGFNRADVGDFLQDIQCDHVASIDAWNNGEEYASVFVLERGGGQT